MGLIGKIFGSDKVIGKAVDGIYNGVDKLAFTEQEKVENFQKTLSLYEPFKLAQRVIAFTCIMPYAFAWITLFGTSYIMGIDTTAQETLMNGSMGEICKMIAIFYFGGGAINSISTAIKGNK